MFIADQLKILYMRITSSVEMDEYSSPLGNFTENRFSKRLLPSVILKRTEGAGWSEAAAGVLLVFVSSLMQIFLFIS